MNPQQTIFGSELFNPRTDQEGVREMLRCHPELRGPQKLMELWGEYTRLTGRQIKFTSLERYSREFS